MHWRHGVPEGRAMSHTTPDSRDLPTSPIVPVLAQQRAESGDRRPDRDQSLLRIASGAYAPSRAWAQGSAEERHLALIDAAFAKYGQQLVLLGASAALCHGLPVVGRIPRLVQCLGGEGQRPRTSLLQRRGRALHPQQVGLVGRINATTVPTTCVDLARWGGLAQGVCAMDAALAEQRCTRAELRAEIEAIPSPARGIVAARTACRLADGRSTSPGESLSRVRMWELGLPKPTLHHSMTIDEHTYRLTFFWPQFEAVGEYDDATTYRGSGAALEEAAKAGRDRERSLRRAGLHIARWTWTDVLREGAPGMARELAAVGVHPTAKRW